MSWSEGLVGFAPFIMIICIVGFGTLMARSRSRHRAELQKELLTKFSSAQELSDFMKTEGGKLLMPEPIKRRTPATRAGIGVLVLIVGVGLFIASTHPPDPDAGRGMFTGGVIVIAAGIGLIISAFVTQQLSSKWSEENQQQR